MAKIIRIPGLIDVHVHLREPGVEHKEDFVTGTMAAVAGGYTSIIDMPNNPEPTTSLQALEKKIGLLSGRIFCDVGFHFGATIGNFSEYSKVVNQVFGLKIYMDHTTGNLLIEDKTALEKIFAEWPASRRILVHAEAEMLSQAIQYAKKYKKMLHACHVSLKEEVSLIESAKRDGLDITAETACHYLFLTEEDIPRLGSRALMKPHLKSKADQDALWNGINTGVIDMIASDHAPHTIDEKASDQPPFGVPGLETSLPLMLTAMHEKRISLERLIELMSINPGSIFGIPSDPSTYVELDLEYVYDIRSINLYTKCKWSPFEGMKVFGKIMKVVLRGEVVFENGEFTGKRFGRFIKPIV